LSDDFLRALGIHRIPVPIPFVEAGGPVNVYFLENEDGTYTLFDTGLGSPEAEAAFRASVKEAGLDVAKVRRMLISHGHIDHYGMAQTLAEETGAPVHVHPLDWEKVVGEGRWVMRAREYSDYFRKQGVVPGVLEAMMDRTRKTMNFARRVDASRAVKLEAGERFRFRHFEVEVLHLPGHTPGLVCLWDAEHRILFADDHILAKVSPNPLLELGEKGEEDKFLALIRYFESARVVHQMDIDWVLPGHGPPFQGHRVLLEGLFAFYEKRQAKLLARLSEGEATPVQLVELLFGQADPGRLFLTLSEVIGNLEVLEAQGKVTRKLRGDVYQYSSASV
jgi:glyoxylase-like metal-dependent hydrolase (beta-lactamase superfamily II)